MAVQRGKGQVIAMGKVFLGAYFSKLMVQINKAQVNAMDKAILGDYVWKLMLPFNRNRQCTAE